MDDHPLLRDGLTARINQETDMRVCGQADSASKALAQLEATAPDVTIVDLGLKGGHGLQLIRDVKTRKIRTRILVLSAYSEDVFGRRALHGGAHGYVSKDQPQSNIIGAIREVAAGRRYLSERLAQRLLEDVIASPTQEPSAELLSTRELQIFEMIGDGKSTREIADALCLSFHTVETHRERIRSKLNLKNGRELLQNAVAWVLSNR